MQETAITVVGEGGVKLAVRSFPAPAKDAPGLLLHHGLASSSHIWDLMLPRVTRHFRVVAYDARGHGKSAKPARGYGFDHVVADVLAVIRDTGLRRPALAGHSWGAMVALELAARHPRSIRAAVLVDGGVGSLHGSMDWRSAKNRLAPPHLEGMPVEEFLAMVRTILGESLEVTPDVERVALSLMRVRRDGTIRPNLSRANHFRILRAIWEQDPLMLYPHVRVPTLAIVSRSAAGDDEDETLAEAKREAVASVRVAALGRPVRISWMEGIHDLPLQHPDALAERIRRFAGRPRVPHAAP
jgi:pimeloyl-ACP methyl ester carboxylesterase